MKKNNLKKIFAVALLATGFIAYSRGGEAAKIIPAANCHFTGNSSDVCFASDGTNNYEISNCKPGSTTCGYNPVVVLETAN